LSVLATKDAAGGYGPGGEVEHVARGEIRPLSRWGAIVLVALVALGAAGCNKDTNTANPAPSASLPRASAGVGGPKTDGTSSGAPSASAALADGRHAAYLTNLNVEKKTLAFDKIDFLTGEAATKEYIKENPGQTEGPDNDYLIINNNPLLRTLPIADSATILIVDMTGGGVAAKKTTLAALPAYFAPEKGSKILWHDPFWLTVKAGQITKIEEQFLP
jgi:hypothetical protein